MVHSSSDRPPAGSLGTAKSEQHNDAPRCRRHATPYSPPYGHAFVKTSLKLWPFADLVETTLLGVTLDGASPMNSTPNPAATDPNDDLVARADERLAHAYDQIARADEQIARVTQRLSQLEDGTMRKPSAVSDRRPSRGRPGLRGFAGLLLAACIFLAAFVWQSSYDDAARLTIARWAPRLLSTSASPSLGNPGLSAQSGSSSAQLAAAEPAPARSPAPAVPQDVVATTAPLSPELAQTLQTMARDLAIMQRGIEQLKAGQEQIASDNARAIEQLKAGQDQMARDNAKAAEQLKAMASFTARVSKPGLQPTTPTPPARTIAAPARQPVPPRPSPQARVQP
jgi:hypothetical protein